MNIYSQECDKPSCDKDAVFLFGLPDCNNSDYNLEFEDEFEGTSVDLSKWNPVTGVNRDFDFKQQKAWHQPENLEVSNGTLKIIAKKLDTQHIGTFVTDWNSNPYITQTSAFDYTTGEIWSKLKFSYGKYQIRCRLPAGKGFWPAFWTFGGLRWNEIDVFEIYGDDMNRFTCNVHYDYDGDDCKYDCSYAQDNLTDFTQWHTYTCVYDFDKITWWVDGNLIRIFYRYRTITGFPISCGEAIANGVYTLEKSYPIEDMHIVANLAIQSGDDSPDVSTIFPNSMEIDYIRYWKKSNTCNNDVLKWSPFTGTSIGDKGLLFGNAMVSSGTSATVIVRNYLTIKPNFSAKQGSFFAAKVNPYVCGSSARVEDDTLFVVEDDNLQRLIHNPDATYVDTELISEIVNDERVSVYPNPTEGIIKIKNLNQQIGSRLEIFNMMGHKVASFIISENSLLYDFSNQPKGLYLIKIRGGSNEHFTKVIYN